MSHEGGPESTQQRTVAELLAKYGGDAAERAPRRRRRREEDSDSGPETIIDRVTSESDKLPPVRDDQPLPTRPPRRQRPASHQQPPAEPRQAPPRRAAPAARPAPAAHPPTMPPQQPVPRPAPQQPSQPLPKPPPPQQQSQPLPQPPKIQPRPAITPSQPAMRPVQPPPRRERPPAPPPQMPSGAFPAPEAAPPPHASGYFPTPIPPVAPRNGNVPEASTEQMPRIPPANRNNTGAHPVPLPPPRAGFGPSPAPPAGPEQRGEHFSEEFTEYSLDEVRRLEEFTGEDDVGEEEFVDDDLDDEVTSPGREWLIMAVQVALSVVGGAAVWLGFNWLWGRYPQAALGAAIVVIVGLVWIVRKIRRADDLQTTGLAVLVGLFVTVSPAALLLLSR